MLLRDHPLISGYGNPSWPPNWMLINGQGSTRLRGEIGVLKGIRANDVPSTRRCFLYMQYEGSFYLGCLLFNDTIFCRQMVELLLANRERPIAEIGSLDITYP